MERQNNFDFLRLLFSSLVIFSHSFPLTQNEEILAKFTNNQLEFGSLSVNIFFIMSGYLIFNSLKFSKTPQSYIWKRILRLFPALLVMLLISLLIIIWVYRGNNILCQTDFYTYLPNNLSLYKVQHFVNGVFENNPLPKDINGSLWSLSYEFTMYIFVLLLFPIRKNKLLVIITLSLFFLISYYAILFRPSFLKNIFALISLKTIHLYRLSTFFIAGSLLSLVNLQKVNNNWIKTFLFLGLVMSIILDVYNIFSFLLLPLLVILVCISFSKQLAFIPNLIGDISYGVYIYGFIVQQTLMNFFILNPYELAVISLSITYIFSYLSWNYVEKKMLKYKNMF
ncbi:acyltransferase family protein [Epilithonimonas arachidiradicis]|uniref:Peptidoglycan/LPS O-acetylase OafA/YrhL n=1 Tax=Epilithonimonas arachidiradicis TaxID=1617282 RepID=A0A420CYC0_9FLAO|nr:peptidoglycan/LPS O-acetylase OafA/YrhL [Epilithonimonas arachidiradicis]